MNDKVRSIRDKAGGESPAAQVFRRQALTAASEMLDAMFDGADDLLFEMAQRAEGTADHHLHFDAMRAVRLERPRISRSFFDELGDILVHGPTATDSAPGPDELDLMKPEELEESVAVANMANKATAANRTLIAALEARLATLAERNELAPNGISPTALCHAFRQAMSPVELDIGVKLLIYKLYDYALGDRLQNVYVDLIDLLDEHKVVPKSTPAAPKRRPAAAARSSRPANRWTQRMANARRAIAPESHYGVGEILDSLATLEKEQALDDAKAMLDTLVDHLRDRQDDAIPRNLQRDTRMLLARVTTMFRELLEDSRVRPPIRPLLERLRLPLLKTAILDSGFFRDAEHPARQLVNELATLDVAANDPYAAEAEDLVNRLVEGFDDNPDLLETVAIALHELSRRWERDNGDGAGSRAARIARAKRMAVLELRQQTLGRHLPDQAKPFLLKAWGPFVAIRYLRFGPNSREWREAATLLTRILDELQPPDGPGRGAARRPGQAALIEEIRQLLQGVAIDDLRLTHALTALEKAFEAANAADPPRPSADEAVSVAELASWNPDAEILDTRDSRREHEPRRKAKRPQSPSAPPAAAPPVELDDETVIRLLTTACRPGMWFQLHTGGERAMRWLKFSCYDRNSGMVYFVNRDGERVFERTAVDFAADLHTGRSRPIYDADQFERRLAEIIGEHSRGLDSD